MKNGLWLLVVLIILTSCSREQDLLNTEISGTWKLTEALWDPGDGSGVFQYVEEGRIIEFKEDGTILARETFCVSDSVFAQAEVVATYSIRDSSIVPLDCKQPGMNIPFEINFYLEDKNLILAYPCIEPCLEKYTKIE